MRTAACIAALVILFAAIPAMGLAQDFGVTDSSQARMRDQLSRLTSAELEARSAKRRWFQQRGYTNVLVDVVRHDGLSAAISYLRLIARLELALPHNRLYLYVPVQQPDRDPTRLPGFTGAPSGPIAVPLQESKRFPVDPWRPELR